jgi:hypothetical protein
MLQVIRALSIFLEFKDKNYFLIFFYLNTLHLSYFIFFCIINFFFLQNKNSLSIFTFFKKLLHNPQ